MLGEILAGPKQTEECGQVLRRSELTMIEQLESERQRTQERLDDFDNAIKALKENPKILEVLQLISKVRRY